MAGRHTRVALIAALLILIAAVALGISAANSSASPSRPQAENVSLSTALDLTVPRVKWHVLKWRHEFGGKHYGASWRVMSCDRTPDGGAKCPWTANLRNRAGEHITCSGDSYFTRNGHKGRFDGACVV